MFEFNVFMRFVYQNIQKPLTCKVKNTVDPVYSERGYSEYPLIVNGFLRTDR
jgi:hypothetical protein